MSAPSSRKNFVDRVLLAERGQRVGRIIHAAAVGFVAADGKRQIAADGQFEHFDAFWRRRQVALLLMRRSGRRQEPDRVQRRLFAATFRQQKMAQMDRVERAAEDADAHVT